MTFDKWLDEQDADGKTNWHRISEEVDLERVMTGNMSHNLARRNLYKWLEKAFLEGSTHE